MPNEKTMSAEERIARAACVYLFSEPPDQALINSCAEAIAAELEAYAAEKVREVELECIRLQQEINCLRMPPCQLPHCVKAEAKEREACAKVAETLIIYTGPGGIDPEPFQKAVAEAIRARGTK